ncbi:MAG: D-2-hydroxyacid dehydrogenase [Bryobacterales bacterium]|nr:D-2-hydroxyacid dehydrogenase [Bryobacterales bacterium]
MSQDQVTRRSILAATGAAPLAAAAGDRTPVTTGALTQLAMQRPAGAPLRIVTMYKFDPAELQQIVERAAPHAAVEIKICDTRDEFRRELRDAEVVYGGMSGADLDFAPKVKWMQAGGAGMEGMDPKIKASPLVITNYARTFAHGISETAIGLLLALSRGLVKYYLPQFYLKKTNNPVGSPKSDHHVELVGRTMGIVGMGGIGSMIARRAHYGLDMRIVGIDPKPMPKPEYVAELHDPAYLMKMVPQVDVLVAAAPHTPQTERMFNEQVFRSMKKTAYFIAMSRGALFDDMALVKALKEGWIAGAGLDVFPKEPAPAGHPIFDCDNVILSAHTSGWSPDRQVRLIDVFADNVRRYAAGLPLVNVVDKEKGY